MLKGKFSRKSRNEELDRQAAIAKELGPPALPAWSGTWCDRAREALSLGDGRADDLVRQAFADHNLNSDDPVNWRQLLEIYIVRHSGFPRRLPGPQKKEFDYWKELRQVAEETRQTLRTNLGREPSDELVAQKLAGHARFRTKGRGRGVAGLRKQLSQLRKREAEDAQTGLSDSPSTEEWVRRRNAQVAVRPPRAGRRPRLVPHSPEYIRALRDWWEEWRKRRNQQLAKETADIINGLIRIINGLIRNLRRDR
jgi:hypothetical protein